MAITRKLSLGWPLVALAYIVSWIASCSGVMFRFAGFFISKSRTKKRARLIDRPFYHKKNAFVIKCVVLTVKYVSRLKIFDKYVFRPDCLKNCLCISILFSFFGIEHKFCSGILDIPEKSPMQGSDKKKGYHFHAWIQVDNKNITDPDSTAELCRLCYALM